MSAASRLPQQHSLLLVVVLYLSQFFPTSQPSWPGKESLPQMGSGPARAGWVAGLRPAAQYVSFPVPNMPWVVAEIQGLEEVKPTPVAFRPCYWWMCRPERLGLAPAMNSRVAGAALRFSRT